MDKNQFFELFKQSIKNRFNFLEAKKREWLDLKSESKKKKLIVELIQLDPSHLAEDWILDQVIKWMKDRKNNIDYIHGAFIAKGNRKELTENQRNSLAKTSFEFHKISKAVQKTGSRAKAVREIVLKSDDDDLPEQPEKAIEQKLKRYRKALDDRVLPFPYYGKDFLEVDKGNENHRIEFYIFNKPITLADHACFGNTTFSYPVKSTK
jgi:hypothetical protein